MNELLKVFENEKFGKVRVVTKDNEPWFVGRDLVVALGFLDYTHAVLDHVAEDDRINSKSQGVFDPEFGQRGTWLINESGFYSLVFGSKLKEAKDFKRWVTHEVLPSIRKNGIYATDEIIEKTINDPDYMIGILTKLKEEKQKRVEAEKKNAILMHVNKTYTVTEIAKELNMKSAIELNNKLAENKIQFKQNGTWVLYSKYSNKGYEEIKQEVLDSGRIVYHRRITQLGREFILEIFTNK